MTIALVTTATKVTIDGNSAASLSITINGTTAGNALVAYGSIFCNDTTTTLDSVTDGGNTFIVRQAQATKSGDGNQEIVAIGSAVNISGGNRTVAFNFSSTVLKYAVLGCLEFSGVATSGAEDAFDVNGEIDTSSVDVSAGPITTADSGDLIVGSAMSHASDSTLNWSSPTNWTNSYREGDANNHASIDAGYWLPGSVQTNYTAQWTHDNNASDKGAGVIVALKPAGGSALSATGTGSATLTGASQASGAISMTGTAAMTMAGAALAEAALNSQGESDLEMEGVSAVQAAFSASGQAILEMTGASTATSALLAEGAGTLTTEGSSLATAALNAAGEATVEWVGSSAAEGAGAFSMDGSSTVEWTGASQATATLSSEGTAEASFVGQGGAAPEPEAAEPAPLPPGGGAWTRPSYIKARRRKKLREEDEELIAILKQAAPYLLQGRRTLH